jgi:type IV secretion system protein VirB3
MPVTTRNAGLWADVLFIGLTRPPMRWGVSYTALLVNLVCVMEVFVLTKQLLMLLLVVPIHGVCALLCARDARFFELAVLWFRARVPAWLGNGRYFRSSSAGPLRCRRSRLGRKTISLVLA